MTTATNRPASGATTSSVRSRDFWGSAIRLVKQLGPQRKLAVMVIALGITGTAISVIVPRILGHATDLLFNGIIGRGLPAGISKAQAVAAARRTDRRHQRRALPRRLGDGAGGFVRGLCINRRSPRGLPSIYWLGFTAGA